MAARKTSKSWFVKLKAPDGTEGEVKVKGVTTPEDAIGKVEVPDGYAIISARPVRKFSVKADPVPEDGHYLSDGTDPCDLIEGDPNAST